MAIFVSNNKQSNGTEGGAATIIAFGTKIKGEVNTDCHFHVDGEFEGTIKSKGTVIIGKTGIIKGEVFSQKLIISGKIIGSVESKIVEILPHGRLEGVTIADELVIERKGVLIGESVLLSERLIDKKGDKESNKENKKINDF